MNNLLRSKIGRWLVLLGLCCQAWSVCAQETATQAPQGGLPPPYYEYPYGSATTRLRLLTVEEAVGLALANASAYQQAQLNEQSAREDVRQARAAFLPQFGVPLGYTGTTPSRVRLPDEPLTFSFVSASAINETTAFVNATGPIDLSGRLRASLRRSRALLSAAHAGTQVARRDLALATYDAYYGLVLARQKRRLADETLALAEAFLNVALRLRERGAAAPPADPEQAAAERAEQESEVQRARSAAAARRDELEQARFAESAAMSLLRVYTGVDFATDISVVRLTQNVPTAADFMDYTVELIKERPELAMLEAQQRAAVEDARIARSDRRPQFSYGLNMGFDAADVRRLRQFSGGAAVISLNIPVWDFGASKSRETQARLQARSLELQRDVTLRQLRQEFYTQRAAALSALVRIRSAETAAGAAQQNLNLVFVRYKQGNAGITDVIDAQADYAATRLAYYQAITDYHTARIRLEVDPAQRAATRGPAQPLPDARVQPCTLTRAQAPTLGPLRLGQTAAQVTSLLPPMNLSAADELGRVRAVLRGAELRGRAFTLPLLADVDTLELEFTDGVLTRVRVNYAATSRWESKDQFLSMVAAQMNLPGPWTAAYDWREKDIRDLKDLRDYALDCPDFRLSVGIGLEGLGADQTPHLMLEDLAATRLHMQREAGRQK